MRRLLVAIVGLGVVSGVAALVDPAVTGVGPVIAILGGAVVALVVVS